MRARRPTLRAHRTTCAPSGAYSDDSTPAPSTPISNASAQNSALTAAGSKPPAAPATVCAPHRRNDHPIAILAAARRHLSCWRLFSPARHHRPPAPPEKSADAQVLPSRMTSARSERDSLLDAFPRRLSHRRCPRHHPHCNQPPPAICSARRRPPADGSGDPARCPPRRALSGMPRHRKRQRHARSAARRSRPRPQPAPASGESFWCVDAAPIAQAARPAPHPHPAARSHRPSTNSNKSARTSSPTPPMNCAPRSPWSTAIWKPSSKPRRC